MTSCCCEPAPDECRSGFITDSLSQGTFAQVHLDSVMILDGLSRLTSQPSVQSVTVVRNGRLVASWGNLTDSQYVASVTKSVVALLVGIAVNKGWIDDMDDPMEKYLADYFDETTDARKKKITLRHLLTMQHGLQWNEAADRLYGNYVQWAVDLPMDTLPGTKFTYSSAAYHLLSAILTEAAGRSTLDIAREELFEPLDITGITWLQDPQGIYLGGVGLHLKPRDMAKIAMMVAQCGQYHYRIVVPLAWIDASGTAPADAGTPYDDSYGLGWWVRTQDGHRIMIARGFGGQTMYVARDIATVVTTTGSSETVHAAADSFVYSFVLSAIRDSLVKEIYER